MSRIATRAGLVALLLLLAAGRVGAEPSLRLEAGATTHHGEDTASEPGFAFGGSLALTRWAPSEHLALVPQIELLFARQNISLALAGAGPAPVSMDSFEIPLLLRGEATLGDRAFYALGGGYAGLLLRAQSTKRDGVVQRADTATTTDLGWLAGAGVELASFAWGTLFVEMRYQRSTRALLAASDSSPERFSVLLGYGLGSVHSSASSSSSSWARDRSLSMKGGFVATRTAGASGYGPGVSFGAAFSPARLGSRVALAPQFEALFVHRSAEPRESGADSLALDSLESSALVRAELAFSEKSVYGVGGAYASALLRAQRTRDGVTTDVRGSLRSLDLGWVTGAGVEFTAATRIRLALELRYQRSLRETASTSLDPGSRDTFFCLIGITHGGSPGPGSGPASPSRETETVEALYSGTAGGDAAKKSSPGIRVAGGPVVLGRPGDRWLDTIPFQTVERATHDGHFGYTVTYHISDHGKVVLFWRRAYIDFSRRSPGFRSTTMKLRKGRLWIPTRVTHRSLPAVHRAVLEIERDHVRQTDGAIAAVDGFALVVSLAGLKPTLSATTSSKPPPVKVRKPGRAATRQAAKGKAGKSKARKGKARKNKARKTAGQVQGHWVPENLSASKRAIEYQARFGRRGYAYRVNGVDFDGVANGVLLEAKGPGYASFVQKNGQFHEWFLERGGAGFLSQARRQIIAADGAPIYWHIAEEAVAKAIRALFRRKEIKGIRVLFTP